MKRLNIRCRLSRPGVEAGTRRHVKSMAPETEPC